MAPQTEYWFLYDKFLDYEWPIPLLMAAGSTVWYLLMVYVVWPQMVPTSASGKSFVMQLRYWHNMVLFAVSTFCCTSAFYYLYTNDELNEKAMTCNTPSVWMQQLNLFFLFTKIWEMFDTMFLVLLKPNGKLQFLHVYHHATTFWLFLLVSDLPGPLKMGLLLNGFVHCLMYLHYAHPFPSAIVPLITISQILQLFYVTYIWSISPSICGDQFVQFPKHHLLEFVTPYCFVPVYIIFFLKFFFDRWIWPLLFGKKPKQLPASK